MIAAETHCLILSIVTSCTSYLPPQHGHAVHASIAELQRYRQCSATFVRNAVFTCVRTVVLKWKPLCINILYIALISHRFQLMMIALGSVIIVRKRNKGIRKAILLARIRSLCLPCPDCRVWQLHTQDFFRVKNSAPCEKIVRHT